jgi:putative ABC transport system permease protein
MVRNYLTIALRNLRRNLGYTVINLVGLAVGMGACLLIGLYVGEELSYDDFHAAAPRIHVLGIDNEYFGRGTATSYPLASALKSQLPLVDRAVRTYEVPGAPVRTAGGAIENERRLLLADPAFFEVFDFPVVRGDAEAALRAPDGVVLTASTARTFFGGDDPIGQTLAVEVEDSTHMLTVRGVAENVPEHSTLQFALVAPTDLLPAEERGSGSWGRRMFRTYALLGRAAPPDTVAARAERVVRTQARDRLPDRTYFSVPLPELYLSSEHSAEGFRGQWRYLYIFGAIAIFILLIAAINYVNLATAQATQRAREVGVRKAVGAGRGQLARQFIGESVLLSAAALGLGLGFAAATIPAFNAVFGTSISILGDGALLTGLSAVAFVIGTAAGIYPAIILTRFRPTQVLRDASRTTTGGGGWLRRGLVVVQFSISIALLAGTIVVYQQLGYVQSKPLGFDAGQVAALSLGEDVSVTNEALHRELRAHPGVRAVSVANALPARLGVRIGRDPDQISDEAETEKDRFRWVPITADTTLAETLGLRFIAGKDLGSAGGPRRVLLNEAAARGMGWTPAEAVGKPFQAGRETGRVAGVVENFHVSSLHEEIWPVVITEGEPERRRLVAVKFASESVRSGVEHVRQVLAGLAPEDEFDYRFFDEEFDAMYRSEERLGQVVTAFAGIAILIACLGLFALAAHTAGRRRKEIGIRKVLGATRTNIVALLSREFLLLVALASVVGAPVAYLAMDRWLRDFAYRIDLSPVFFLGASALAMTIALATISVQALRAARTDPAATLRHE